MRTKLGMFILVGLLLVVSFQVSDTYAITDVEETPTSGGYNTAYSFQRKIFYANGLWWVFYGDEANVVYRTSSNGMDWSSKTTIRTGISGHRIGVWFDGTYVHYGFSTYTTGQGMYYRRGTPNTNGTITWSDSEQTVFSGVAGKLPYYPYVSVDSSGYPWYAYCTSSPNTNVTKSSFNNGTWSHDTGFPVLLTATTGYDCVTVLPLTNDRMYVIYGGTNKALLGKLWNGTAFGSEETISTSNVAEGIGYSAVAEDDDVHVIYRTVSPLNMTYRKRTYGTGWGSETVLKSLLAGTRSSLSIDTLTGNLYATWFNKTGSSEPLYLYEYSDGSWQSEVTVLTADAGTVGFTSSYEVQNNRLGIVWTTATSPYTVKFKSLFGLEVQTQDADGTDISRTFTYEVTTPESAIDSYREGNQDNYWFLADLHPSDSGYKSAGGQAFQVTSNLNLVSTKVYLQLGEGSPIGNAYARLYAATGTFGTNARPTGSALATSDDLDISTVGASWALYTFNFTGSNQYSMQANTDYVIVYENPTSGTVDTSNYLRIGTDTSSPTHDGNEALYENGVWTGYPNIDTIFYIYGIEQTDFTSSSAGLAILEGGSGDYTFDVKWGDHTVASSSGTSPTSSVSVTTKIQRLNGGSDYPDNYLLFSLDNTDLVTPELIEPHNWRMESVTGSGSIEFKMDNTNWIKASEPYSFTVETSTYTSGTSTWAFSSNIFTFTVDFSTQTLSMTWDAPEAPPSGGGGGGGGLPEEPVIPLPLPTEPVVPVQPVPVIPIEPVEPALLAPGVILIIGSIVAVIGYGEFRRRNPSARRAFKNRAKHKKIKWPKLSKTKVKWEKRKKRR